MFRQASCLQYLPSPSLLSGPRAGFRSPHRSSASPRYGRRSLSGLLNCHLPLADLDFTLAWRTDPRDEILEPVAFGLPDELREWLLVEPLHAVGTDQRQLFRQRPGEREGGG